MKFYSSEPMLKQIEQDSIDKQIEEFFSKGNKIKHIKMGETGVDDENRRISTKRGTRNSAQARRAK